MTATGEYHLPEELARHAEVRAPLRPEELREACSLAGEGLGREDAARGEFRVAAEMISLWRGLDLPGWEALYVLRAARLGYLSGFDRALLGDGLTEEAVSRAASARWGKRWPGRLEILRGRLSVGGSGT